MKTVMASKNADRLAARLKRLRMLRQESRASLLADNPKRRSLSKAERELIFQKTAGRCHICGGRIKANEQWQADHVIAHAHGGKHAVENYLPAHALCNNYRWFSSPEEFQWILKLGVWIRTQIEKQNSQARHLPE